MLEPIEGRAQPLPTEDFITYRFGMTLPRLRERRVKPMARFTVQVGECGLFSGVGQKCVQFVIARIPAAIADVVAAAGKRQIVVRIVLAISRTLDVAYVGLD